MNQITRTFLSGTVLSAVDTVRVIVQVHPLRRERVVSDMLAGDTVLEFITAIYGQAPEWPLAVELCNETSSVAIEPDKWRVVRPKPGSVLAIRPRLQGGSGLKLALLLAVAVAGLVLSAGLAAPLLGTAFAAGTWGAVLGGAGVVLGGSLAINALFPVRPPAEVPQEAFSQLPSIAGAQNQLGTIDQCIPSVRGTHRFSPFLAAKPYTELVGDDQFLILLFCWGYGPLSISDLKIGETPLASFTDYQIETREGYDSDAAITLYPSAVDEQSLAIELTSAGGSDSGGQATPLADGAITWFSRTSAAGTNILSVDVTAPEGIFRVDATSGQPVYYQVSVKVQYRAVGSGSWIDWATLVFGRSMKTARQGLRLVVGSGQYEVQVGKAQQTYDTPDVKEAVVWTALRSFTTDNPINFPQPLALTALRIKATGQLSGEINTFNGVVSSKAKAWNGSIWVDDTVTQSPADLVRLELQAPDNARPVDDDLIDLANLQDFKTFCTAQGFKFNMVRSSATSVYDRIADICAAAFARPGFIDGKWAVVWDRPSDPIVQHLTPRNSWGFSGSRVYAQRPHGWRIAFINESNGYTQDERIVYDDGYDETNATLFEAIQFPGVTDPSQVWKLGRRHIAQVRLRPEELSISLGWENLVCTAGDRVRVTHDAMLIGQVSGRVKTIAGQVITVDETITIESGKTYGFTFRNASTSSRSVTRAVDAVMVAGEYAKGSNITLVGDLTVIDTSALFGFGETSQDSAVYRVKGIRHQKDLIAQVALVDDAPEISLADQGTIPDYDPHVSLPVDPFTQPPRDFQYIEIMEGYGPSVRGIIRLSWQVPRIGHILSFEVQQRDDDSGGDFITVATVPAPSTTIDIELAAAGIWSFRVRCLFEGGGVSAWATLAGLNLTGLTSAPGDITNLHQRSIDGQTHLGWDIVADQRALLYEVRKGTSWDTGLVVGDDVAQPPWATTGDGTYHVRAYVASPYGTRIYSVAIASITIVDSIIQRNIIVSQDEQALGWPGGLDGGVIDGSFIRTDIAETIGEPWAQEVIDQLAIEGLHVAVYLSARTVDIGRPAECRFWTEFEATGVLQGEDFLATTDVLASQDILGSVSTRFIRAFPIWRFSTEGDTDVFGPADVFAPADVFTGDITWQDWVAIASGTRVSRFFQPGFVIITDKADVDATGTKFRWFVDVPDRTDDYTDLAVPDTGLAISFYSGGYDETPTPGATATPFNGGTNDAPFPHVQRAIINGTNGDEVKITSLTLSGCTVHVVNADVNVTRAGVNLLVRGF